MNRIVIPLLCLSATLVHAQDGPPITINVPVSVSNMHPDVSHVMVGCEILDEDGRRMEFIDNDVRADDSYLVDGAFNGTLKAVGGGNFTPASARSYVCVLRFGIAGVPAVHYPGPLPSGWSPGWTPGNDAEADYIAERMQHDDSAPFRYVVEGTF